MAVGANNNRFYFTLNNGNPEPRWWREYFLVTRAKGLRHDGQRIDFSAVNVVIANSGGTYTLPVGAGSETVGAQETGYNAQGESGTNTNGSHPYRYPYRAIWIDVTQINTTNKTWGLTPKGGYYESHIQITTQNAAVLTLNLAGQYWQTAWNTKPFVNTFSVERIYTQPIPYIELEMRTTLASSLDIATIRYLSTVDKARIYISSDASGIGTNFVFTSKDGSATLPYRLAYQSTLSSSSPVEITMANQSFLTTKTSMESPIDGDTYSVHRLEGKVRLFLDPLADPPTPGVYSSNVYVVVQKN